MNPSDKGKQTMPMPQTSVPMSMPRMSMPMPSNMSSASRQSAHADLLPRYYSPVPVSIAPYPYQSAFTSGQAVELGLLSNVQAPTSVFMGFPQRSSASSLPLPSHVVPSPMMVNAGLQISTSKKRPAQRQAPTRVPTSMAQGSQLLSSTNKRPSQMVPPPKVQAVLFESVRSKLRESLTASLAMVPDQQNKGQVVEKDSPKEAVNTSPKTEVGTEVVKVNPPTSSSSACKSSPEDLASNELNTKRKEGQDVPCDTGPDGHICDQSAKSEDIVLEDQIVEASLENGTPFSINPITDDELLQGHGLCWVSDIDTVNSGSTIEQDLKRPKLSSEEVTEGPKLLDEVTERAKASDAVTGGTKPSNAVTGGTKPSNIKVTEGAQPSDEEITGDSKKSALKNAESLAIKIEAELFKLFGGVNKKYKEKARSLLFNLKDRSNPELRERVLSGDITPERLCSMTAEELASKELSQWRLAKAEELAQMVVLPDTEVDMRRLVKKTHKGEFQVVEVEQDDNISVEVAVGESVRSQIPAKAKGGQTQPKSNDSQVRSMPHETKSSEDLPLSEKGNSGGQNDTNNLDTLLNEKADLMQDLMVDELKDTELLPPIVSLDEFMQALDTEPPFDNLSVATNISEKNSGNLVSEMDPESDSSEPKPDSASENVISKFDSSDDKSELKVSPSATVSQNPEDIGTGNNGKVDSISRSDSDVKPLSVHVETDAHLPDTRSRSENIWEGLLQLNISSLATVVGSFRSGEKTSTQEWPSFLEIKGRVRLDAFEKFLQELPLSRSRAIMIAHFCWKEGSHESGRLNVCETANSYVADQRLGFAEPAPGVELYFCPPHLKTTEMFERHLPKDYTEFLHSTVNGLIGLVVWRRPHVTTISPRLSSHHKHGTGTKRQSSLRRQQQNVINSSNTSISSSDANRKPPDAELIDDIPPGFGPGNTRDEDDLPEFDFSRNNSLQKGVVGMANSSAHSHPHPPGQPVNQMRELILKYGNGDNTKKYGIGIQAWNDDDDIPEWQPHHNNQPQQPRQQQQQLPPPPPPQMPPLPPQPHPHSNYQQQAVQQQHLFFVNQNLTPAPAQQQMQHLMLQSLPVPMPLQPMQPQFHHQTGFVQGQNNVNISVNPGWQQGGTSWPPSARGPSPAEFGGGPMMQPCHFNPTNQPGGNGQFYGAPSFGGAAPLGWRPDVPRN